MIRVVLFTAVGFWLSREYYERYHADKRRTRETNVERRLTKFLAREGLNNKEIEEVKNEILG